MLALAAASPSILPTDVKCSQGHAEVAYNILFLKSGKPLAARTVVGCYNQELRVELHDLMRVDVLTRAPESDGRSFTEAKMAMYGVASWHIVQNMKMEAMLSLTPSFEYSVDQTPYRFVVMPRQIVDATNQ